MLTDAHIQFMKFHGFRYDFNNLSDDDYINILMQLGDLLVAKGLDESYDDNEIGNMCREIMAAIPE